MRPQPDKESPHQRFRIDQPQLPRAVEPAAEAPEPTTPSRHRHHPNGNHFHKGPQRVQGKDDELFNDIADTKDEHTNSVGSQ